MAVTGKEAVTLEQLKSLSGLGGGGISEIPIATEDTLGGVKVGENVSVDETGVLTAQTATLEEFKEYMGGSVNEDGSVSSYELPIASSTTLGGVKIGEGINITEDGVISSSGGDLSSSVDNETIAYGISGGSSKVLYLMESSVGSENIKNLSVVSEKINNGAVTTEKISNKSVTLEKLNVDIQEKIKDVVWETLWEGWTETSDIPIPDIESYTRLRATFNVGSDYAIRELTKVVYEDVSGWFCDPTALGNQGENFGNTVVEINYSRGVAFQIKEGVGLTKAYIGSNASYGWSVVNGSASRISIPITKIEGAK